MATPDPRIDEVLNFWFEEAKPEQWWASDPAFDEEVRKRFASLHREAGAGRLDGWMDTPDGALALVIVLDQFSRNLYRGSAEAFAEDGKALVLAEEAIQKGFDQEVPKDRRAFFYMPHMHTENLAVQDRCVELIRERLGEDSMNMPHAVWHRNVIEEFGRFPYRNQALGRETTEAEAAFLARENVPG